MKKFSFFSLARNALSHHERWPEQWRSPAPKPAYDVVIIGAGGHGLATAYYLASLHGITDVAVLEKGWLGGGNTGRNTTVIRSNYLWDESAALYEHSLKLWEGLAQELNYNLMFSQRGVLNLIHNGHDLQEATRRVNANRLNAVDAELLSTDEVKAFCPILNTAPTTRYPILGGTLQRRGGNARHDAIAWGFARAADARGVDIIQNCEVTGIDVDGGRVTGVQTTQGAIKACKVAIAVAGHSSVLAADGGLPIADRKSSAAGAGLGAAQARAQLRRHVEQRARLREPVRQGRAGDRRRPRPAPTPTVSAAACHIIEDQIGALVELIPIFSRVRMMRSWAGIVDVCPDASPVIGRTPVDGLFISGGWGTGGFKATPGSGWVLAHTVATGEPHPLSAPFALDRFTSGALIDENAAAGVAH